MQSTHWANHSGILTSVERFVIKTIYADKTLWPCEAKRSKAREIGVGQFYWPSSDNLKRKTL